MIPVSAAILAAILNYENCSMIQKMYQAFYVSRVSWASESVEKKTISAKSTYNGQTAWLYHPLIGIIVMCVKQIKYTEYLTNEQGIIIGCQWITRYDRMGNTAPL